MASVRVRDGALSVPQVRGMDRAVEVELGELVDEPSTDPLASALEAAGAAHVWYLISAEPLLNQVQDEVDELPGAIVVDARHGF